jgi:Fe-S oxidoreductase
MIAHRVKATDEKESAFCCGGSLANIPISQENKRKLVNSALVTLIKNKPEMILTSCPLCKKTFSGQSDIPVKDIAELAAQSIIHTPNQGNGCETDIIPENKSKRKGVTVNF